MLVATGLALLLWNVRRTPKTTALTGNGGSNANGTIVLPQ
jgi:hypothetical protein